MGRPRKPTAIHELNGSFDKHPERKAERKHEPKPISAIGIPPACFLITHPTHGCYEAERLLAIWNEVVSQCPPGVLTYADRIHVELVCRLTDRVRGNRAKAGDFSRLDSLLGKLGMNPADRSKVSIAPTAASTNETARSKTFEDLAGEAGARRVN